MEIPVLYEDNHLLVVDKPPGILSQADKSGTSDLLSECREYVKQKYQKPGNVYLGLVHRLDRGTGGVLVLARTSKAASRLSLQFREKQVQKTYHAVLEGKISPPTGVLEDHTFKDRERRMAFLGRPGQSGARLAKLSYRTLKNVRHRTIDCELSFVEVELFTGRFHQIRFQFSCRGFPVLGDQKYGARNGAGPWPALWAFRLGIDHPVSGARLEFLSPTPPGWPFHGGD